MEAPEGSFEFDSGEIKYEGPTNLIYEFNGVFTDAHRPEIYEALSLENTLWADTILAS